MAVARQERPAATVVGSRDETRGAFQHNNFNLLRLLAAAQVMIFHSLEHLHVAVPIWLAPLKCFPGVPVFFAISGFLVSASYERSGSLFSYFRNRFLRIYPGLWVVTIAGVLVAMAFGYSFWRLDALTWFLAECAGLISTPAFLRDFGYGSLNASLWTIPLELQFYFVLPAVYALALRTRSPTRVIVMLLVVFSAIAWLAAWALPNMGLAGETRGEKIFRYTFIPHVFLFLAGIVMQRFSAHTSPLFRGQALPWTIAYLAFWYAMPASPHTYVVTLLFLAGWAISFAYTAPGLADRMLGDTDISYGLYIYHGLVLNVLVALGLTGNGGYLAVVMVAAAVLAYLSWVLVERPSLRRKRSTLKAV